jgi:hypothetical protein
LEGCNWKESGLPIPGVNIQIKNSTKGTATDFDGKFSLKGLPSGSTVVFTYIGFKDFEYKVTGNNSGLNVSLVGDAKVWTKLLLLVMVAKKEGSDRCRIYCR